jgi:hypothetical protein
MAADGGAAPSSFGLPLVLRGSSAQAGACPADCPRDRSWCQVQRRVRRRHAPLLGRLRLDDDHPDDRLGRWRPCHDGARSRALRPWALVPADRRPSWPRGSDAPDGWCVVPLATPCVMSITGWGWAGGRSLAARRRAMPGDTRRGLGHPALGRGNRSCTWERPHAGRAGTPAGSLSRRGARRTPPRRRDRQATAPGPLPAS